MSLKDKYFTLSQASKKMGVTRQTLARWITERKFPAEKIGREKLLLKSDIEKLVCPTCGQLIRKSVQVP